MAKLVSADWGHKNQLGKSRLATWLDNTAFLIAREYYNEQALQFYLFQPNIIRIINESCILSPFRIKWLDATGHINNIQTPEWNGQHTMHFMVNRDSEIEKWKTVMFSIICY